MTSPLRGDSQGAKPGESQKNSEWARRTGRVVFAKKEGVRISKCMECQLLQKGQVKIFSHVLNFINKVNKLRPQE